MEARNDSSNRTCEKQTSGSKFSGLYKSNKYKAKMSQEGRRKQFLEEIRSKRAQVLNQNRNISTQPIVAERETVKPPEIPKFVQKHSQKNYSNKLMLSEFFTEVPSDLDEKWLVKLCPIGSRRLVVSQNKTTVAYNKFGTIKDKFPSKLPGGSKKSSETTTTILDCIYNHQLHCYFVLDILVWAGQNFQESESDFRFFFLKSKLQEIPEMAERNCYNHRRFVEIDCFDATCELIEERVTHRYVIENQTVLIDGLLFYHKETSYIAGENPLVGWLKPNELPDVLKMSVPDYYLDEETVNTLKKNRKKKEFQTEDMLGQLVNGMEVD